MSLVQPAYNGVCPCYLFVFTLEVSRDEYGYPCPGLLFVWCNSPWLLERQCSKRNKRPIHHGTVGTSQNPINVFSRCILCIVCKNNCSEQKWLLLSTRRNQSRLACNRSFLPHHYYLVPCALNAAITDTMTPPLCSGDESSFAVAVPRGAHYPWVE